MCLLSDKQHSQPPPLEPHSHLRRSGLITSGDRLGGDAPMEGRGAKAKGVRVLWDSTRVRWLRLDQAYTTHTARYSRIIGFRRVAHFCGGYTEVRAAEVGGAWRMT